MGSGAGQIGGTAAPPMHAVRRRKGEAQAASSGPDPRRRWVRHRLPDTLGILWVLVAAGAALTPALAHGASLGNYDLQTVYGGLAQTGAKVRWQQASDQLTLFMPLSHLAWTQVHQGHLPLWNPYNALGIPLAFNWESATFSVPVLLGYLVPVHLAYTVQVIATYAIAGVGVYVLGRVLRLGVLGCAMAGTVYELSGPLFSLVGWSFGGVMAWAGWLLAAAILVLRGRRRVRAVAFFAVIVACAIYAGEPEALVFLAIAVVVVVVVVVGSRLRRYGGRGRILRPVIDLAVAGAAGAALGAPLVLPGLQVGGSSIRNFRGGECPITGGCGRPHGLPLIDLVHVLFQGFNGLPVSGSQWFPPSAIYINTVAYVGVIAVVLGVLAIATRRSQPEVLAFGAIAVVMTSLVFAAPVVSFMDDMPFHLGGVLWYRATGCMAFSLAILAGVGTDVLVRTGSSRRVRTWLGASFGAVGLVLAALWLLGRGHLPPAEASIRANSFIWPVAATVVGLGVFAGLARTQRRQASADGSPSRRCSWAAATFLACETAFLVAAGAPVWSSSPTGFTPTPAVVAMQHAVGSSVVGLGIPGCYHVGLTTDVNAVYGVQELTAYDPVILRGYFVNWRASTGQSAGPVGDFYYCPAVTTAKMARRYGVAYVIEPPEAQGPQGGVFDRKLGDEDLYKIPGAAAATLTATSKNGQLPGPDAPGKPVIVTHSDPASWKLVAHSSTPAVLRLRLTDLPGWRGTIDGRPLRLLTFSGVMIQARIPAGTHTIVLHYWPNTFTLGLVLAACSAAGLLVAALVGGVRGRQKASSASSSMGLGPTEP